ESPQHLARRGHGHAVQIQFRLAAIVAAAQLAQHGMLHAVAAPRQIVAGFNIHWWRVEQFIHDGTGVGFRLLWPDRRAASVGSTPVAVERVYRADGSAEQSTIVVIDGRVFPVFGAVCVGSVFHADTPVIIYNGEYKIRARADKPARPGSGTPVAPLRSINRHAITAQQ